MSSQTGEGKSTETYTGFVVCGDTRIETPGEVSVYTF